MKSIFPFNLQKPLDIHRVKKKRKEKKNQRRDKEEKEKKKNLKSDRLISSQTKEVSYPVPRPFITDHFHFTLVLQRLPSKKNEGKEGGGRGGGRDEVGRPFWTFPFPRIDKILWRDEDRREEGEREKGDGYKKKGRGEEKEEEGWKTLERGRAAGGRTRKGQRDGQISSLLWVRFNLCCSRRPLEASLAAIFFWIDVQKLQSLTPR